MRLAPVVMLGLLVSACAGDRDSGTTNRATRSDSVVVDSSMALVARAASVALAMEMPRPNADSALAAASMTLEQYESLMYRVAADTALTRLFLEATEKR